MPIGSHSEGRIRFAFVVPMSRSISAPKCLKSAVERVF